MQYQHQFPPAVFLSPGNSQSCKIQDPNQITGKKYYDPIHGYFGLENFYWDIIDTETFQRTRNLKQLGCVNYVFPTAVHNRFEHCIGTCYLAKKLMKKISKKQPELGITWDDIQNVSVAGLCHDLGHGPFSHVFDNHFLRTLNPQIEWTHEWASTRLLEYLIEKSSDNGERRAIDFAQEDVRLICDLITGNKAGHSEKLWMFDIINNKRNSIDVDKWDYIIRDTQMMNLSFGQFDHSILLGDARVIEDQLVYPQKHAYEVQKLFQCRYDLYKSIYNHLTVHSIEIILCDVFHEANGVLYDFLKVIYDPEAYTYLTDNILYEIQVSEDPRLNRAKELIKRLKCRQFYPFVGEILVPPQINAKVFTEQDIINCARQEGYLDLQESDIALRKYSVNFAQGHKDPFENVKFYNPPNFKSCFLLQNEGVSLIRPKIFQEHILRLFVRDPAKQDLAYKAFCQFGKEKVGVDPKTGKEGGQKKYNTQDTYSQFLY